MNASLNMKWYGKNMELCVCVCVCALRDAFIKWVHVRVSIEKTHIANKCSYVMHPKIGYLQIDLKICAQFVQHL